MAEDQIYARPINDVQPFEFNDQVAEVFEDMIARSVPGYAAMLSMTRVMAQRLVDPGTKVFDLGTSLGTAVRLIRPCIPATASIIAVDSSPSMIRRLNEKLRSDSAETSSPSVPNLASVEVRCEDVRQTEIADASLVILNLTLQFIPVADRLPLLRRIHSGLRAGGALLLSEKVRFESADVQHWLTELHHDFKRAHGYSDLEIAQKRTALENTLIPETIETHRQRLHQAGFATSALWFQCFNFISLLAIKGEAHACVDDVS